MLTGIQLRLLRQSNGLMQKELADIMDIKQQRLSILEKRKDKISDRACAKALFALKISEEAAMKFLNSIPPSSGGGGGNNGVNYFTNSHFLTSFFLQNEYDKTTGYNFLFVASGFSEGTAYTTTNY